MIEYRDNINNISPENISGFFEDWRKKVTEKDHLEILTNSEFKILAMDGKKTVGFINAITDNKLSAYIPLLEVLTEYRNQGIGKELVKRMLKKLENYYMIDLCCDENLISFYGKLGMKKVAGMIIRNYDIL